MKLVLTDRDISFKSKNIEVKKTDIKSLSGFSGNGDVIAVVGTRAMAEVCANIDLPCLKLFQLTSAGFDNVPLNTFREKNVSVANAGNVYSTPIAETVVYGILSVAKKLRFNPNNRRFKLARGYSYITELEGKKAVILGAGNIGTAVAQRLAGFSITIDGYDPYCTQKPQYNKIIRSKEELKEKLWEYDYIISTLPDNEQTRGMFDNTFFCKMKKSAVVVNVGRNAVFNQKDFYKALKSKKIGGAVLDMFEVLPNPITNPFRRLRNVVVLPGVAAISVEVKKRLDAHICSNLNRLALDEPLEFVIN